MKTSIRDIVRREKWATAFHEAIAGLPNDASPLYFDKDTVTVKVRTYCVLVDSGEDT